MNFGVRKFETKFEEVFILELSRKKYEKNREKL